jgi:SAM-dependent methyltransferase
MAKAIDSRLFTIERERKYRRIETILTSPSAPEHCDSDEVFDKLHKAYSARPPYNFDAYSTWKRGVERAMNLMDRFEIVRKPPLEIFEAGCGDGMTGHALVYYGHSVLIQDIEDWRDMRAKVVRFLRSDLCKKLPLSSDQFDIVYSYNTFEHLDDPSFALSELTRISRKYIYLEFGPLYSSPWGLHAHRSFLMPYPQFLFSEPYLAEKFALFGIYDLGKKRNALQPMNRWSVGQFEELWNETGCSIIFSHELVDDSHLDIIEMFPKAFQGRGLSLRDVTTQAIYIGFMKK